MRALRRTIVLSGLLLAGACRPPSASVQPPAPASAPQAPAVVDAPPTQPPAPAPADPLADLDEAAQWRWAVERLPALAELVTEPTGSLDLLVPVGGKVTLYSPDIEPEGLEMFRAKPCTPITLVREGDTLASRLPIEPGPARPDLRDRYVVLKLAKELAIGPRVEGKVESQSGSSSYRVPLLRAVEADTLRYDAHAASFGVACAWHHTHRQCDDGTTQKCRRCDPVLIEIPRYGATSSASTITKGPCEPCPPEGADIADALDRVVQGRSFLVPTEGPWFFGTKKACQDKKLAQAVAVAEAAVTEPDPDQLYDVVLSFISPGDGADREAADELARFIPQLGPLLYHARGHWGKEGEHDECFDLKELEPAARKRFLAFARRLAKKPKVDLAERARCRNDRG